MSTLSQASRAFIPSIVIAVLHVLLIVVYVVFLATKREAWLVLAGVALLGDLTYCSRQRRTSRFARISFLACAALALLALASYLVFWA